MYLPGFSSTAHETAPPSLDGVPRVGSPAATVLRNVPETTSLFSRNMLSSPPLGANREEGSMDAYAPEIERRMKRLFDSLSEDDRRRYAAVETTKLGHGGIEYIAQLLQCDPKTIRRGLAELDEAADLDTSRVRKKGGGRKKLIEVSAALEENFLKVLEDHTAGDPMRADVKWTNLSRGEIAEPRHRVGNSSQSARRFPVAPQTQVPQAKGIEEEDDGSPQSEPQCPVREHRPFEEGVFEGRPASHQHGHQEEGIAGQFLPRRQDRHPGNDRDQRPRLRQCGGGHGDPPQPLRCGEEQGLRPPQYQPRHQRTGL